MRLADSETEATAGSDREHTPLTWAVLARIAFVYAVARALVVFTALASAWLSNGQQTIYNAFTKWDSAWYAYIGLSGYPDNLNIEGGNRWAFFPGWPLLLRVADWTVGGSWQRNGIALAAILGFVSAVLMYLTIADALGEEVAHRSTVLIAFAPAAALLSMVYSEVLFIPCCAACLLFLGRRQWWLAGAAAAAGGLTRIGGVALIAACAFEAAMEYRRTRSWRPFVAPLLAPIGIVAFFVYQRSTVGTWNAYGKAQSYWGNGSSYGWPIVETIGRLMTSSDEWYYPPAVLVPIVVISTFASAVLLLRTAGVPGRWWVFAVVLGGIGLAPTLIFSVPRLLLPIFPLTAGYASRVPTRYFPVVVAASAALMVTFGVLYFNTTAFQMAP